jgi:hypothetical protein
MTRAARTGRPRKKRHTPPPELPAPTEAELDAEEQRFAQAWSPALAVWSKFTRLHPPVWCRDDAAAARAGLTESFAMIRLADQSIVINLAEVARRRIGEYAIEILAHEIGHHILAPATLTDHARMIARMRWALPSVEHLAPMVANLYTDLLINDRLERSAELRVDHIYRLLGTGESPGAVWTLYLRIYEVLWNLPRGALSLEKLPDALEGDAWLGARLLRSYSRDWLDGSGRFAALLFPHLLEDQASLPVLQRIFDTRDAAVGGEPAGLSDADPEERAGAVHPALDETLGEGSGDPPKPVAPAQASRGQAREPFEYGEILRAAGLKLSDHDVAVQYYREQALPHLVRFPRRRLPESSDPLPEGLEPWDIGQPLDTVDWLQSVLYSPKPIPGMTTLQRLWGTSQGASPALEALDLDLYVDSSGSMANPQRNISYPALAGAIVCLSALRAGARVQATLWSGKQQYESTQGFVRNEKEILRVLTGFFGGATAFPIHVLRDTFAERSASARPVHILVISDDGVTTLFDQDEKGNSGWTITKMALERARGGATFVLNLYADLDAPPPKYFEPAYRDLCRARDELGIHVHRVTSWEELVQFARDFSRLKYSPEEA